MRRGQRIRFVPDGYGGPVEGRVLWVHPLGRFVLAEYRVQTLFGGLSVPIRECVPPGSDPPDGRRRGRHQKEQKGT